MFSNNIFLFKKQIKKQNMFTNHNIFPYFSKEMYGDNQTRHIVVRFFGYSLMGYFLFK